MGGVLTLFRCWKFDDAEFIAVEALDEFIADENLNTAREWYERVAGIWPDTHEEVDLYGGSKIAAALREMIAFYRESNLSWPNIIGCDRKYTLA